MTTSTADQAAEAALDARLADGLDESVTGDPLFHSLEAVLAEHGQSHLLNKSKKRSPTSRDTNGS